ncbi:hypothetical protein EXE58_19150 [Nocardioides seonyuensis]|uniref:Condensation domain-containing protein n=1 Tax=Nocardioides seonyuensis TaxID=2518371 RepID=A0A4P7IJ03_9ACTN|nr:condensation domain-containing protein [Nocardioides seonyuensis]QBX57334.1 hypothetical protein EXE58_19150 [Nocardioides seonyuensis]
MQMTRLDDHETVTGEVWLLRPSLRTRQAMGRAERSDAQPSYLQTAHLDLRLAMERIGKRDASWLALAFEREGRIDPQVLARTLTTWVRRHGVLQGWFTVGEGGYVRHDVHVDDIEFVAEAAGRVDDMTSLRAVVGPLLDEVCTPFDTLGYTMVAVASQERSAVYLGQDHCYSDGFSVMIAFTEINEIYEALEEGRPVDLPPTVSYTDYAQVEREAAAQVTVEHPAIAYWADYAMKDMGTLATFPMELGLAPGQQEVLVPARIDLLDGPETEAVERLARQDGATFPSVVYAACAIAARDLAGRSAYRFLNPIHTRTTAEQLPAMGWFVNLTPIHVDLAAGDDIVSIARRVRETFRSAQVCADVPVLRVMELVKEVFGFESDSIQRPPIVSYLDGRLVPGSERWDAQRFFGLTGGGDDDDVNVWINRMPAGTHVMCSVPDTPTAVTNVRAFFEHARDTLHDYLARGGDGESSLS